MKKLTAAALVALFAVSSASVAFANDEAQAESQATSTTEVHRADGSSKKVEKKTKHVGGHNVKKGKKAAKHEHATETKTTEVDAAGNKTETEHKATSDASSEASHSH